MALEFELNGKAVSLDVDPAMPLLWAIRDQHPDSPSSRLMSFAEAEDIHLSRFQRTIPQRE